MLLNWALYVFCVIYVTHMTSSLQQQCDNHCYPGESCWPTLTQMLELYKNIDGKILSMYDKEFVEVNRMMNTRVQKIPYFIILAASVDDVIYAVKFANKFNIKINIKSSGHDYIGRSTWDGSLEINLRNMKDLKFDLNSSLHPAGIVTAESGNSWLRLYNETNKINRVIVGGSAHTVSMGGYTLGGGHSPIGRKFGMAVDNLLGVEMVTVNGSFVKVNENGTTFVDRATGHQTHSANADIFWALRGGGGSTYGIVTSFTYKLHYDSKMEKVTCYIPYADFSGHKLGRPVLEKFNNLLATSLAPEWGGYEIFLSSGTAPNHGSVILFLNHFGETGTPSYNTLLPFLTEHAYMCRVEHVANFLEYEITAHDDLYYRSYIFNTLVQPDSFNDAYYDELDSMLSHNDYSDNVGCTGTLIGGNMKNVAADDTAVNPNFRSGVMSLSCGISWSDVFSDRAKIARAEELTTQIVKLGKGVYFNEPSAKLDDWKYQYWGGHYDRLLSIKKVWDPENILTCLHCVGSDEVDLHGTGSIPAFVG